MIDLLYTNLLIGISKHFMFKVHLGPALAIYGISTISKHFMFKVHMVLQVVKLILIL